MNLLQQFMDECNRQARPIVQEAFTFVGDVTEKVYYGTFGDPEIMPVMTRQGYQDHLVTILKAEASQWSEAVPCGWPAEWGKTEPKARGSLVRTSTGRTFFIQTVDYTGVVVFTFILTDREL